MFGEKRPEEDTPTTTGTGQNLDHEDQILAEAVNLSNASVGKVEADLVRISQSGASQVTANEIELQQSAAVSVEGQNVQFHRGVIGYAKAGTFTP
ncbi:MAG: hypothetical protein P8074_18400 [Anaerolineales bacterium]